MNCVLIDSHAHLDMKDFDKDREQVIQRAQQERVISLLCPIDATSAQSIETVLGMTDSHENIISAAGVHPHQADHFVNHHLEQIEELVENPNVRAVGEIGLDFHYNYSSTNKQKEAFQCQLKIAQKKNLPVVIHSRNAGKEVLSAVQGEHYTQGGVLHCFSEDWEIAKKMMDLNFFISFSGIITYPGAKDMREVVKKIPLDRILVETDSPYLIPVPLKGNFKRNEPAFVVHTINLIAELKKISISRLSSALVRNFENLFAFEIKHGRC